MYSQLDLEAMFKRSPKRRIPPNFHGFWNKEFHCKRYPKKDFDI
jgi:hypothetical protein